MFKKLTLIGVLAVLSVFATAQPREIKPLKIGDLVPDVNIDSIMNFYSGPARLADFQNNLLLLDFWSTWCSACIAGFQKLNSLQDRFPDIRILLVNAKSKLTNDNSSKIRNTLQRLSERIGKSITLPVVYDNAALDSLFPTLYIPQIVWIKDGKVIAITASDQVTAENIEKTLKGDTPALYMKRDQFSYDSDTPLFVNSNGGSGDEFLFRSMVTGYIEGIGGSKGERVVNDKIVGCHYLNHSLLDLLKIAYSDANFLARNRVIIESENVNFKEMDAPSFKYDHAFCYELIIPPSDQQQVQMYMREDLKRYFGVIVKNERRIAKCLILSRYAPQPIASSIGNISSIDLQAGSIKKHIHNRSVPFVVRVLNQYSALPIIDETNSDSLVLLDLPYDLSDLTALKKALSSAGFELKEETREIELTIVADLKRLD